MKKRLPLLLLLFMGSMPGWGQVRLGILGGIHSANVLETNHIPGWDTATGKFERSHTGFQLGVMLEVPIGHTGFYFQPAITYITKGRVYDRNNDSLTALATDTIYHKQTLNINYVEVPLDLTYKFPIAHNAHNSFFLSAGPYVSFVYSGSVTTESLVSGASVSNGYSSSTEKVQVGKGPDTYKTLDIGVNARAGFEMGNVVISGYFSQGLTSFYNAPYPGSFHHQVLGVSAGIWLSSSGTPAHQPRDTDKDGINDEDDVCPLQPGTIANHGCPTPDTDHDGVDDEHDSCPTIPGLASNHGCPVTDTDHDGIDDEHDSCPTVPGLARYHGCPIPDRDHDGINDEEDQCPDSAGPASNHGCPLPAPAPEIRQDTVERVNNIARAILFESSSDRLIDGSFAVLDTLAGLLIRHPEWHLTIEGYTDNSGIAAKNRQLSAKRAAAVKRYLVTKGIPAARLTAVGYGQERPVADNRTVEGRAANRRVELKLNVP